ncbi:MAG: M23 family metallopeptidase [Melioribacteraceae bacterium]|nr:M23 family metallopeptidase [Melioribacteraceae bacterium]
MKFNLKDIRDFSVYITPNFKTTTTTRYKFSLIKMLMYIGLYTITAWLFLLVILSVTPLKNSLFVIDDNEMVAQAEKIEALQNKVYDLTAQLQSLATNNERLKFAFQLAQRDSIKKDDSLYNTLQKTIKKKIKIGGDFYTAFISLIDKYFPNSDTINNKMIFIEPTQGVITQSYKPEKGHFGTDYGVKKGSPVFASAGGLVIFSGFTPDFGYTIIIKHDNNYITLYKHCSSLLKKSRDIVYQGELIALSGNSGTNTTGPHLHFEIWHNGKSLDPESILLK